MRSFIYSMSMIIAMLSFTGCAGTTVTPSARNFSSTQIDNNGLSIVYIVREGVMQGSAVSISHLIDDQEVGSLGNGDGYLIVALDPGEHEFKWSATSFAGSVVEKKKFSISEAEKKTIKYSVTSNILIIPYKNEHIANKTLGNYVSVIDPVLAKKREQKKQQLLRAEQSTPSIIQAYDNIPNESIMQKNINNKLISYIDSKDISGLSKYLASEPNAASMDPLAQLLLSGPKELRVIDIKSLLVKGKNHSFISSMITSSGGPYKKFTVSDILLLEKIGIPDDIVTSMLDITREYNKNKR